MCESMVKLDNHFIAMIDPRTFKSFENGDYFILEKYIATRFYSSLGLYNALFVKRLYDMDKDYTIKTVGERLSKSNINLSCIGSRFYVFDNDYPYELYNDVAAYANEHKSLTAMSSDGSKFNLLDSKLCVKVNFKENLFSVYHVGTSELKYYMVPYYEGSIHEFAASIFQDAVDDDIDFKIYYPDSDEEPNSSFTQTPKDLFNQSFRKYYAMDDKERLENLDTMTGTYNTAIANW